MLPLPIRVDEVDRGAGKVKHRFPTAAVAEAELPGWPRATNRACEIDPHKYPCFSTIPISTIERQYDFTLIVAPGGLFHDHRRLLPA